MYFDRVKRSEPEIDFETAVQKCFNGLSKTKKKEKHIDGLSWYQISRLGDRYRTNFLGLTITNVFRDIFENSEIRKITFDINGCGDDGGVECVEFEDKDGNNLSLHHQTIHISHYPVFSSDETEYRWGLPYEFGIDTQKMNGLLPNPIEIVHTGNDEDAFVATINSFIEDLNVPGGFGLENVFDKWTLVKMNSVKKEAEISCRLIKPNAIRNLPGHMNEDSCHPVSREFPNISRTTWPDLEDHAYRQLTGGWEINEGSQNVVTYHILETSKKNEKGDKFIVKMDVREEQNEMRTNEYESSYTYCSTAKDEYNDFLESIKVDRFNKLHFHLKKDREKILQIMEYLNRKSLGDGNGSLSS